MGYQIQLFLYLMALMRYLRNKVEGQKIKFSTLRAKTMKKKQKL